MKRYKAKQRARCVSLMLLLLAALWPVGTGWAEAPIGRFVIGVYKPAGWSGGMTPTCAGFSGQVSASAVVDCNDRTANARWVLASTPRPGRPGA